MSEPFYHLRYNGHFVNDLSYWDESIPSYISYNLTKLFECDEVIKIHFQKFNLQYTTYIILHILYTKTG